MTDLWEPGKPWLHPSIARLTISQLRDKIELSEFEIAEATSFDEGPEKDEYLASLRERIDVYQKAIKSR